MRYQDRLINYINGIIHDYEQSVDLTQETFIRLFKNAHKYEGKYKFSTWLYRIATNIAIDELRGRNKKGRFFFRNVLDCFRSDEDSFGEELLLPDTSFCPGKALEESEKASYLQSAISSLAEPYRVPFLLKEVQDLSYEEVSHVTQSSSGYRQIKGSQGKAAVERKAAGCPMNCSEVQHKLAENQAHRYGEEIREHLKNCPECREFCSSIEELDSLSRVLGAQYRAPRDFQARVFEDYKARSSGGWFSFRSVLASICLVAFLAGAVAAWDHLGNGGNLRAGNPGQKRPRLTPGLRSLPCRKSLMRIHMLKWL